MRKRYIILILALIVLVGCNKDETVPIPSAGGNSILDDTYPLRPDSKAILEGVYLLTGDTEGFGDTAIVKWNRSHMLIATKNGKYFVMDAGYLDSVVFIQGYWRDGYSSNTGIAAFRISKENGGISVVTGKPGDQLKITGGIGSEYGVADRSFNLTFLRPFAPALMNKPFHILGHRGGGRTSDLLPVSENSLAMINFAERLGCTGIEVDVRLTSDGIPFLYHDGDINTRLTRKGPLAGPAESYTWLQLSTFVELIHGEKIPTLEEALIFTIDSTLLDFVYLDTKSAEVIPQTVEIMGRMKIRAEQQGRDILIVCGIPNDEIRDEFMKVPDYRNIASLCELTVDDVRSLNSRVWSPRWTLGMQNDLVQQMHNEGRLAVTWTIDQPGWIRSYINEGLFDGLLTNYPYVVAYYHYIQQ